MKVACLWCVPINSDKEPFFVHFRGKFFAVFPSSIPGWGSRGIWFHGLNILASLSIFYIVRPIILKIENSVVAKIHISIAKTPARPLRRTRNLRHVPPHAHARVYQLRLSEFNKCYVKQNQNQEFTNLSVAVL